MPIPFVTNADGSLFIPVGQSVYVARDVVHLNSTFGLFTNGTATISVDGTVVSTSSFAIVLGNNTSGVNDNRVLIGDTGVLRSLSTAGFAGIVANGSGDEIANFGEISGSVGVLMRNGANMSLSNAGTIAGMDYDTFDSIGSGPGVQILNSSAFHVVNHGLITGGTGMNITDSSGEVVNLGVISAMPMGDGSSAPEPSYAIFTQNTALRLQNDGQIIGGGSTAIQMDNGADVVTNSGAILGDVRLGDGRDMYRAYDTGRVDGTVFGGLGSDVLWGAEAHDHILGEAGFDDLRGGGGRDTLEGGGGNDTLRGGVGDDLVIGGAEDDEIHGGTGGDTLQGGDGRDTLMGQGGADEIAGGGGSDTLMGNHGEDTLSGGSGFDLLQGGLAGDSLMGEAGSDTLIGAGGEDTLQGGENADSLSGGGMDDLLQGDSGFDRLDGGRGADTLEGGPGNDTLIGGRGDDDLSGGTGADVFVFGWANGNDVIHDFQNTLDRIDLSLLDVALPDVIAAVSAVGTTAVMLDLTALGASGTVLIDGVPLAGIGGGDFIL